MLNRKCTRPVFAVRVVNSKIVCYSIACHHFLDYLNSLHLNEVAVDGTSRHNGLLGDGKATCGDGEDAVAGHFS